tara:strand:+ start:56 stop:358 length:303 start_codon:yes stop_codon:yes gene_type:complete
MKTLHLVTDGRLMHTVHVERGISRAQIQSNKDVIEKLKSEATAPSEIIICDDDNMEIGNITVPFDYEDENVNVVYDKLIILVFSAVVVIAYIAVIHSLLN